MFTEEEMKEFLNLFGTFARQTGLSDAALATLLCVTHITVNRWSRMYNLPSTKQRTVYRRIATPAREKILHLVELDRTTGLFATVQKEKQADRLAILRRHVESLAA